MVQQYETIVIFTPLLSDEQARQLSKDYQKLLEDAGAEIIHEDFWGLKQLAYPIRKKTTGLYTVLEFKSDTDLIARMELQFKRDEQILRFLTTRLDKYALKYNEDRRNGLIGRKNNPKPEEQAAG